MSSLHQRAKDVFLAALARPPADRAAFLAEACGDRRGLAAGSRVAAGISRREAARRRHGCRTPPTAVFAPGEVFAGRYRMIARIGRGGMGDVWRADDLVLETPVALKLIDSTDPDGRERILNEVRLARQITHPAVCRVFDVGEAEGGIFFSMELVRGEDLAALLRRVGRLPSEKVVDIARQLCAGLAAAHAQGVLHRDLKPANVLIDDDGLGSDHRFRDRDPEGRRRAPHADRHAGLHGARTARRRARRSPSRPTSTRWVWCSTSFSSVRLAFSRPGDASPPPRPSTLVADVNPQLERVVMQALSPDPRHRPASALEMAASLPRVGGRR